MVSRGTPLPGLVLGLLLTLSPAGAETAVLSHYQLEGRPQRRFSLPDRLKEISGIAATEDGRLFAHGDERGVIHQLDPASGSILKSFSLGRPGAKGDFEDITIVGSRFFLITSDGDLYETREGDDGASVAWSHTPTGLGSRCEIEGLGYEPATRSLLILCKDPRAAELRGRITIFALALDSLQSAGAIRQAIGNPRSPIVHPIYYRLKSVLKKTGTRHFHPSAITRDPATGHYLVLAGREQAIVELTPEGDVVAGLAFPSGMHPQPEGVSILPDGSLLISDEAAGDAASLSVYARAR